MEQRKFVRTDFNVSGELVTDKGSYPFRLLNISLKGALIQMDQKPEEHKEAKLLIHLHNSDITIKTDALLIRKNDENYGYKFSLIDEDSMIHLRRLLELNTAQPDEISRELGFLMEE